MGVFEDISALIYFFVGCISGLLYVVSCLMTLITGLLELGYNVISQLFAVYSVLFVDGWTALIITGISYTVFYRFYKFIKGVKIAGFGL